MADLNFIGKSTDTFRSAAPAISIKTSSLSTVVSVIGVTMMLGSVIAMGGLFLYHRLQNNKLADLLVEKKAIEDDLRPELVNRLVFVDSLLAQVRQLLQSHIFASNVFPFLEKNIHASAQISDLNLSIDSKKIDMTLIVPSYLAFVEQVKIFEASPFVERVSFNSPGVSEKGISFKVTVLFKQELFERPQ